MEIPKILLDQIETGNAILFLGAGASMGAASPKTKSLPTGQELSDLLATKFLDKNYLNQPLMVVSELAISQSDLFTVQKFIHDIIEPFQPAKFHQLIPTFKWKSIYTTNYDFIIERAYENNKNKIQDLSPVFRNTRYQNIFKASNSLPYYKLHGCLSNINDKTLQLILTPEQYIDHKINREHLFNKLLEEACSFTFIFVGYSFADIEIRTILHTIEQEKEGKPRFYMIGPNIQNAEASFWENKKISSLKMTFENFITLVDNKISKQNRVLSSAGPIAKTPIFNQFAVNVDEVKPSESLLNFIDNDIDYVNSSIPSQSSEAKEFYKGYFVNWDPIIRNLDVKRDTTEAILSEVFLSEYYSDEKEGQTFILIKGFAGSGKSVVLKRLAWDAAISFEKFCIFYKSNTTIKYDHINELYNFCKTRIHIFIDNILSREEEVKRLLEKCRKENLPITIVGAERTNIWNQENNQLKNYIDLEYKIEYLNDKEIKELINLLEKHNSLGFLEGKSSEEKFELLGDKAGRVLLVALYEATHGKPFIQIIKDEYDRIHTDLAKSLYLTVSIMHMLGSFARAGFISRVHGINFSRFKAEFFTPLEFIVFDRRDYKINDYIYQTRHPYIAQMVFEAVLTDEQSRFDEIIRILTYLDVDYDSDRNAFIFLTNAKRLIKLFPNREFVRNIFKKAGELSPNNPKLLQQQAIFEIENQNLAKAESIISEANKLIDGDDPSVLHTFAEIEFKKAELSISNIEKNVFLDRAISLSESLIKKFGTSSFSYHTILKSLNTKLEISLTASDQPTIERLIKEIEKKFRDAKQAFPTQEFILEAEAKFNQIIRNTPEALAILIKAHSINKSSPFIASRLANIYEAGSQIDEALEVLKTTLNYIPGDKDLNYSYAMLLMKKEPNKHKDSIYYLKKSFTEGDNRFQAQFWCARAYYLNNEIEEAKKLFKKLATLAIDPKIKNLPRGYIEDNNKKAIFKGKIKTLENSYGFILRAQFGDDIFFFKFENTQIWNQLKSNTQVTFNIAFNFKGPIAMNIKIFVSETVREQENTLT
jgi:tetratricopeptide (TPR) repeat protein